MPGSATLLSLPNSSPLSYISISSSLTPNPGPNAPRPKHSFNPTKSTSSSKNAISLLPVSASESAIKAPTAPWMTAPLTLQPHQLTNPSKKKASPIDKPRDRGLNDKVSGVRGPKAVNKIVRSIVKLQNSRDSKDAQINTREFEIGGFLEQLGNEEKKKPKSAEGMPWSRDEEALVGRPKKIRAATAAELTLDRELLGRLRNEAKPMRKWVKVKKAGVTQAVVDEITRTWQNNELAMVKFDVPLCRNMDRALEILEIKTRGLVVWTKKDAHYIYRGCNHELTSGGTSQMMDRGVSGSHEEPTSMLNQPDLENKNNTSSVIPNESTRGESIKQREERENEPSVSFLEETMSSQPINISLCEREADRLLDGLGPRYIDWWMRKPLPVDAGLHIKQREERENEPSVSFLEEMRTSQPINISLYEREADRLLDGLGPRYMDWWMRKPLPVDADLLPEVVPGYRLPFRLCPPRARAKLTDEEFTYVRKYARLLPTHFVLGRNRKLQGLAAAILKLWEKSIIVKIAVKWGIPNTSNEQMANELKDLTGGVLLLRNRFYIILYRGKDFVHREVATLIHERETELKKYQLDEEGARLKPIDVVEVDNEPLANSSCVGTLSEFQDIDAKFRGVKKGIRETELQLAAEIGRLDRSLRQQERKLSILNSKIERTTKELSKLKAAWEPSGQDEDHEMMTEEERECFRKIGLKMRSCLVLGRRGVFDGVMEGLHQHWKFREVAKVITMQKLFRQVIYTARFLVAESGGVLVSIEKLKYGHAILLYRGKNYRRPLKLAHKNLLTKREALRRSLEMQRLGSLKYFAYQRQQTISDLKLKLVDVQERLECEREFEV